MYRILIHQIQQRLASTAHVLGLVNKLVSFPRANKMALVQILCSLHEEYRRLVIVQVPRTIPRIYHPRQTFASIMDFAIRVGSTCSEKLRFQSIDQPERLETVFRFPTGFIRTQTYKYIAEEIIPISLCCRTFGILYDSSMLNDIAYKGLNQYLDWCSQHARSNKLCFRTMCLRT